MYGRNTVCVELSTIGHFRRTVEPWNTSSCMTGNYIVWNVVHVDVAFNFLPACCYAKKLTSAENHKYHSVVFI